MWTGLALSFFILLLLNVFIRVRVLKIYRRLVQREVDFEPVHFFDRQRLEQEIIPKYPDDEENIRSFIKLVRFSMTMASIILVLIIYFGFQLFNN